MKPGLLLIDGNGLAWRVATGRMNTGHPTVVLYQLTRAMLELRAQFPGWLPILFFDSGESRLREALYPAYKGNRPMSEDRKRVFGALQIAKTALADLGKPYISVQGCEADDLISIVACEGRLRGVSTIIYSDDTDLYQVLGDAVRQYVPRLGQLLQANEALAEWHGSPSRYLLWKSLAGDDSDNLKGLKGIGKARAHELVALSKGTARWLFSEEAKKVLAEKFWAKVLWSPEGRNQLALAYRLTRTARTYTDLEALGPEAEVEIRRVLSRHREPLTIGECAWVDFVKRYDAFPLVGEQRDIENLYAFHVATELT